MLASLLSSTLKLFKVRSIIKMIFKKQKTCTVFISSYTNTSGSLGEREMLWEHEPQASVSTAFSSSSKLSHCISFDSRLADSLLLRREATSPAKTIKRCMETTPAITDCWYYRIADHWNTNGILRDTKGMLLINKTRSKLQKTVFLQLHVVTNENKMLSMTHLISSFKKDLSFSLSILRRFSFY